MIKSRLAFLCLLLGLLLWVPAKAAVPASSVSVQHLYQYDKAHVLNVSEGGTSSGIRYLNFNGRTSNISLLIQYADAISQGWNLRRLNNYESEHNTFVGGYRRSLSWTYVYTGSGPVTGTVKDLFENYTGQVSIHVSADKNSFSGQIRIVSSMKYETVAEKKAAGKDIMTRKNLEAELKGRLIYEFENGSHMNKWNYCILAKPMDVPA